MKRILINATQNEEIRVALCKGNHLYDFDLENRTREQKKSNIYKGHVTRVEPSLEAVFVEYGSQRQGFLPIREISAEYLSGNPRDENIKKLIKEGDELIVQVEKEERGNKGAALSTYVSLAGRYLVLMPNNPRGGGISRQISGKLREDMKRMLGNLDLPKGMSVIIRTAGIGKTQEDLQHDLNHLLNIWQAIQEQNKKYPSPRLVHQEAGVVTRAVRDYLRDDISEIWIDNENAYVEAAGFIDAVMPKQAEKLRKYTDYEPMFSRFNIEKQIETAYQREVRLPSGGSIVIDQTEALVSIDINSAKSTKGSDVAETAYHTNLEAADEIARQLRLRDMGGLIVIDFIDMNDNKHQKEVEKRLIDATKYDRARVQFGDISKFGLMEMSRQRLRPSLEESTGYICPRCHGNGMIRDLRSLSLSIMRQIEQIALKERQGEVQAEVPTDIAAFLLNEKRDSLVYLEQDSGTRITILPHAHLESPNFKLHFNRDGFAPSSYERITDTQQQEHSDLGYDVDWQTADSTRPEQQPTRQPRQSASKHSDAGSPPQSASRNSATIAPPPAAQAPAKNQADDTRSGRPAQAIAPKAAVQNAQAASVETAQPQAVAWLSNLFAQAPQANTAQSVSSTDAAEAIETLVNTGAQSLGSFGQVDNNALSEQPNTAKPADQVDQQTSHERNERTDSSSRTTNNNRQSTRSSSDEDSGDDRRRRKSRKSRSAKPRPRKETRDETQSSGADNDKPAQDQGSDKPNQDNTRSNERGRPRQNNERNNKNRQRDNSNDERQESTQDSNDNDDARAKRKPHSQRSSRGTLDRNDALTTDNVAKQKNQAGAEAKGKAQTRRNQDPNEVSLQVNEAPAKHKAPEVVHLSLDDSKSKPTNRAAEETQTAPVTKSTKNDKVAASGTDKVAASGTKAVSKPSADTRVPDTAPKDAPKVERPKVTAQASETVAESLTADAQAPVTQQPVEAKTVEATPSAKKDAVHAESIPPKKDAASTQNAAPKKEAVSTESTAAHAAEPAQTSSALSFDHEALFGTRYVTAHQFGHANNDPRVVRQQAQAATSVPVAKSTAPISGTVGQFIHASLDDAERHLADHGVIGSFIAAIAARDASTSAATQGHTDAADADFDFSNYGYAPLTAEYLADFNAKTQPVSQFAAAQGKVEVTPSVIGKRASNDPRGQHPDYREPEQVPEPQTAQETDVPVASSELEVDTPDVEASALTTQAQADDVSTDSEQLLESDQAPSAESIKEAQQAGKSKTTIASYKNMIENVAEQLLPQSGMFNLTTPKVPKARSRKPKTDHKKPTQVEKAETDDDSDDS